MVIDVTPKLAIFISWEHGDGRVFLFQKFKRHVGLYLYWFSVCVSWSE